MIYKILYYIIRKTISNNIVNKRVKGFNKNLYYERRQHLVFLLKPSIIYEPNVWQNIAPFVEKSNLIFDIGSNIGQYALRFSESVNNGRIVCFEPDYKNFAFLQFNIKINKCENVLCENIGIGKEDIEKTFYRDTKTGGRSGSFFIGNVGENHEGQTDTVKLISYDMAVEQYGIPDFVKIDVEGFECEIIRGSFNHFHNTSFLIEVRESTKFEIFNFFHSKKFVCYDVDNKERRLVEKKEDILSCLNLLFTPEINSQRKVILNE